MSETKIKPKALTIKLNRQSVKRFHNAIAMIGLNQGLSSGETLNFALAAVKNMSWQSIAGVKAAGTKDQKIKTF